MKPDDISTELNARGTALAERVRFQVDTDAHLQQILKDKPKRLVLQVATAAAVIIAVLAGVALLRAAPGPPVATAPETTTTTLALRPLPVDIYVVLLADYTVDEANGTCSGTGPLAGVFEGSSMRLVYNDPDFAPDLEQEDTRVEVAAMSLPAGTEMTREAGPPFLFPAGSDAAAHEAGCVFTLSHPGIDLDNVDIVAGVDPSIGASTMTSGQRLITWIGA